MPSWPWKPPPRAVDLGAEFQARRPRFPWAGTLDLEDLAPIMLETTQKYHGLINIYNLHIYYTYIYIRMETNGGVWHEREWEYCAISCFKQICGPAGVFCGCSCDTSCDIVFVSPVDCSFDRFLFLLPYPPLIPQHIHYSLIWSSIL